MPLPSIIDEIDRLFDELVHRPWGAAHQLTPAEWRQVEDGWVIDLPVEGMRVEDLKVEVSGRQLTISGRRQHQQKAQRGQAGWSRIKQESSFHRTFTLPVEADPEDIEAKKEGSTLSIHIRRKQRP